MRIVKALPASAVYVGRPSKWGNPWSISDVCSREEAVSIYRRMICSNPKLVEAAKAELRGKDLVCWCAPLACHADVLLEIANAQDN